MVRIQCIVLILKIRWIVSQNTMHRILVHNTMDRICRNTMDRIIEKKEMCFDRLKLAR